MSSAEGDQGGKERMYLESPRKNDPEIWLAHPKMKKKSCSAVPRRKIRRERVDLEKAASRRKIASFTDLGERARCLYYGEGREHDGRPGKSHQNLSLGTG